MCQLVAKNPILSYHSQKDGPRILHFFYDVPPKINPDEENYLKSKRADNWREKKDILNRRKLGEN